MNTDKPPLAFFEFLDVPLTMRTRVVLAGLVVVLILSFLFPLWRISMVAPQYPDGLYLDIYSYKLEAGNEGRDLKEINILNHYIGMRPITRDELQDLDWLPFGIGVLIILCLRVAVLGNIRSLVDYSMLTGYVLTFAFIRFIYMLYDFGHSLDPKAPLNVEPFTPAILGAKKVANFTTYSSPLMGGVLLTVFVTTVWVLLIRQLWMGRRRAQAWFAGRRAPA